MRIYEWRYGDRVKSLLGWAKTLGLDYDALTREVGKRRRFGLSPNQSLEGSITHLLKKRKDSRHAPNPA